VRSLVTVSIAVGTKYGPIASEAPQKILQTVALRA